MENWQYLLAALLTVLLSAAIRSAAIKRKKRKERDFLRKLETVLLPRETVKVICPQKKGRCVLTSQRLLFDRKEGFQAVPFTRIKRVQGFEKGGKTTASAAKMKSLIIKAERDYVLQRTSSDFEFLAKQLGDRVKKQNEKKKTKK